MKQFPLESRQHYARRNKHVCAIHQPNFFPWLGYFDKIRQADVFIFLDDVRISRTGSWVNRVQIPIQDRLAWIGAPIRRSSRMRRIRDVKIAPSPNWRSKLTRTLEAIYRRAPSFDSAMAMLQPLIHQDTDELATYNIEAVTKISRLLGIRGRFVRQSDMGVAGTGTSLLVSLVQAVGATAYICGGGSQGYQEDELFRQASLELIYQRFVPTPYGNVEHFVPGCSVIDYLMWSTEWR